MAAADLGEPGNREGPPAVRQPVAAVESGGVEPVRAARDGRVATATGLRRGVRLRRLQRCRARLADDAIHRLLVDRGPISTRHTVII